MPRDVFVPLVVAFAVLAGQPIATMFVMQASAHRHDMPVILSTLWFVLFLPSEVFDRLVRSLTGSSPVQVFGAFTADVLLGFGLNAVVWALVSGSFCFIVQKRLTNRWS
jgi:hypothetical protein